MANAQQLSTMKEQDFDRLLHFSTIFGQPRHSRVVFCIDASERLKHMRPVIIRHIEAHLLQMSKTFKTCKFNVVLFAEKTAKFSQDMKEVNKASIQALRLWMKSAALGNMSYVLPGLLYAVNNTQFCCIYLITDGRVNDCEPILLSEIYKISTDFSVFAFVLTENLPPDEDHLKLFRGIATEKDDPWSAITLVTTRYQADKIRLATVSLNSTGTTTPDNEGVNNDEGIDRWLQEQAGSLLISNQRSPGQHRNCCAAGHDQNENVYDHQDQTSEDDFPSPKRGVNQNREKSASSSIQSRGSAVSSASALLLGRHVLAPRRDEDGRLYLGVVKTQRPGKRFGVVFCLPFAEHTDNLDYCHQEVALEDLLSYSDLFRHSLRPGDNALTPVSLLEPDRETDPTAALEPPFAGEPYVLTRVENGYEQRFPEPPPEGRCSSLLVQVLTGGHSRQRPRCCEIPLGCALWIPPDRAASLHAEGSHFFGSAKFHDASPYYDSKEALCVHGSPRRSSPAREKLQSTAGDGSQQESGSEAETDLESSTILKSKKRSLKSANPLAKSADSALFRSESLSSVNRRGKSSRRGCTGSGSEFGNDSDVSSMHEKRSQSSSRFSSSQEKNKKPPWKYWGRSQIPDILDPPVFEPYQPMQTFGPVTVPKIIGPGEWPSAHFAVVNHNAELQSAQNDSSRVYAALQQIQPLPTKLTDDGGVIRSESCGNMEKEHNMEDGNNLEDSLDGNDEGLTGIPLRDLYRQRIAKNLKETKANRRKKSGTKSVKSQ